jgi:hypothetical protein
MAVSLPPAVTVVVSPATQTSEPIAAVSPDAPLQMIYVWLLASGSGDATCPLADLARAVMAAATAAVAAAADDDDETETDGHPGSPSSVCACTQQAAGASNDGQAERMDFRVAQRSLTHIVTRVAQAHGASSRRRTWHMPKDELAILRKARTSVVDGHP